MSKYQTPDSRFFLGRSPISRISEESSNNLDLSYLSSPNKNNINISSSSKKQDSPNNLSTISKNLLLPDILRLKSAAILCSLLQKTFNSLVNHQKYSGFQVIKRDFEVAKLKNLALLKLDYFYHKLKFGVYKKLADNADLKVKKLNFYSNSNKPENFGKTLLRAQILYRDLTYDGSALNFKPVTESQFLTLIRFQRFLSQISYNYKIGRRKRLQYVFHRVYSAAIVTLNEEEILGAKGFCRFSVVLQSNHDQICNRSKLLLTPERSRISLNDSSVSVHILNNNVVKIGEISANDLSSFYNSSISLSPDERIRKFQKKLQNLNKILNKKLPSLKNKNLHTFIHHEQAFSQIFRVFNVGLNRVKTGFFQNFIFISNFRTRWIEAFKTMGLLNKKYLSKRKSQAFYCWRGTIVDSLKRNQMDRNRKEKVRKLEERKRALMKIERIMDRKRLMECIECMRRRGKGYRKIKKVGDILRNQVKLQLIKGMFYIQFLKCRKGFNLDQRACYFNQAANSIRTSRKLWAFYKISAYRRYSDNCLLRVLKLVSELKTAQSRNFHFFFRRLNELRVSHNINEKFNEYEDFKEKLSKSQALKCFTRAQNSLMKYMKELAFKKIVIVANLTNSRMNSLSNMVQILENNRKRSAKASFSQLIADSLEKLSLLITEHTETRKRSSLKGIECLLQKNLNQALSMTLAKFKSNAIRKRIFKSNYFTISSKLNNMLLRRIKDSYYCLNRASIEFKRKADGIKSLYSVINSIICLKRKDFIYIFSSSSQRNDFKYQKFALQLAKTFDRIYSRKVSLAFGTLKSKWETAIVEYLIMQEMVNQKNEERNEYVELLIEKLKRRQRNKDKPLQTRKITDSIDKSCIPLTVSTINGHDEKLKSKAHYPSTLSSIDNATTNTQNDLELSDNQKRINHPKYTPINNRISENSNEDKRRRKFSEKDNGSLVEKAERLLGRTIDFSLKDDVVKKSSERLQNTNRLVSMLKPQYIDYSMNSRLNENNMTADPKVSSSAISRIKSKENSYQEFMNDQDVLEISNNDRILINEDFEKAKRAFRKENSKNSIILSQMKEEYPMRSNVFPIKDNNKLLNNNIPPNNPNEMNFFQSARLKNYQNSSQVKNYQNSSQAGSSTRRFNISNQIFDEILDNRINNVSTHRNELRVRSNKNNEAEESCEMCGNKYRKDEEYMANLYSQEKENTSLYNTGRKHTDLSINYDVLPTKNLRAHFLN